MHPVETTKAPAHGYFQILNIRTNPLKLGFLIPSLQFNTLFISLI